MTERLHNTIDKMANTIVSILAACRPSIYLYGSVTLGDFKKGWSDIDILCLTKEQITQEQADRLVGLRQELLEAEPDNSYYRSFEGGILTCKGFLNQSPDRVVYWGTNGQRITDKYSLDSFSMQQLLDTGILLYGDDARKLMKKPNPEDLKNDIKRHYDTIRKYTQTTGRSLYSFGWLLDIARGLYTLQTGKVIAKTVAGEWALENDFVRCRKR
jgi:predicted nucleotidyltransferase